MIIEEQILKSAAEGNMSAFEEIYKTSSSFVYHLAYRMLSQQQDAEEVVQDVFIKVYHSLKTFRYESSFKTWIYRITVNVCLNRRRHDKNVKMKEVHVEDPAALDYLTAPEHASENKEIASEEKIQAMLSSLNKDQKACLVLRVMEGLSYQEIADILKININTVRTRLLRARQVLVKNFKGRGELL